MMMMRWTTLNDATCTCSRLVVAYLPTDLSISPISCYSGVAAAEAGAPPARGPGSQLHAHPPRRGKGGIRVRACSVFAVPSSRPHTCVIPSQQVHERSTESDLLCFLLRENLAATPQVRNPGSMSLPLHKCPRGCGCGLGCRDRRLTEWIHNKCRRPRWCSCRPRSRAPSSRSVASKHRNE